MDLHTVNGNGIPRDLADLHRRTDVGQRRNVRLPPTMTAIERNDIAIGAGFRVVRGLTSATTTIERQWSLPDTVGPTMRLMICGLNPSPSSADTGIGFARPGNRFWPAALAAGIVSVDRDPRHALAHHGVGMTDIVKRTTRRADELDPHEYHDGLDRLRRLAARLAPAAICFVGLAGWRSAVDKRATPGWQREGLGSTPVYLMPSTSGLNASSQLADLTAHLRQAADGQR